MKLKKYLPYLVAIFSFAIFTVIYFAPSISGKIIYSSDGVSSIGSSREVSKYHEESGKKYNPIIWTNSLFSGMPTYMVAAPDWKNKTINITRISRNIFNTRYAYIFVGLVGVFLLLVMLGINPWLSIVGAFAYNLASFHYILMAHGHNAKAMVVSLYAYVLIGMILVLKHRRYFWGTLLFTFSVVWQIVAGHIQMTYYLLFLALGYYIAEGVAMFKQKQLKEFAKGTGLLLIGAVVAVSTNTGKLWTEYEYGTHTMRGGREITSQNTQASASETSKEGLSNEYILAYSYDLGESFSGFLPQAKGLYKPLSEQSALYKALKSSGNEAVAKSFNKDGQYFYWGHQTASAAPFYYGVVVFVLFILGLFFVKGHVKYWLASVVCVTWILTIGKNSYGEYSGLFYSIQSFFIEYIPLYDKFRDVKNIVFVQSLAMMLLGFIGLSKLFTKELSKKELTTALRNASIIVGGLFLIVVVFPTVLGNTASPRDAMIFKGWPEFLMTALQDTRAEAIRSDAIRGLIFGGVTFGLLLLVVIDKLKVGYALMGLLGIIFIDMVPFDLKSLNYDTFVTQKSTDKLIQESQADIDILKDKDPNYRVLKFGDTFNDALTSAYHKSIGGYSAAKLSRYQDLIEYCLSPFMRKVAASKSNAEMQENLFSNNVINMLNTKYFILDENAQPVKNPNAYGNAWFAHLYITSDGALDEITKLQTINTKKEVVVDKRFVHFVDSKVFAEDSAATISLEKYHPNHLAYKSHTESEQMAVFSEIFYAPNGWQAYIDGEKADHFRVNYVLRAMIIPAGTHTVEFKFEPTSYYAGTKISLVTSYLLTLLLIGGGVFEGYKYWKRNKEKKTV
ncbi:hypothetical protein INQ51_20170 [Maribellus sp. CM-23]|uniref:YfhO family protein n=1 Tax=Maribellus sp. CM-23 TaxID=2781026 RepID=UPI001F1A7C90|nr:YfhO family protein [Maribellus sp. CM-23]MCE4566648.1 hypothetical protein [Maribellus sp. CM-23]